ncbi:hypothetical protein AB0I53_01285 [Saccharopolyspora sp. NPDC050389]|uniref:hypothetical protein n=1 Tax=Saccharopolyspora sp. NPDC050389 TaxID=3155516 RepID=UPI003411024E
MFGEQVGAVPAGRLLDAIGPGRGLRLLLPVSAFALAGIWLAARSGALAEVLLGLVVFCGITSGDRARRERLPGVLRHGRGTDLLRLRLARLARRPRAGRHLHRSAGFSVAYVVQSLGFGLGALTLAQLPLTAAILLGTASAFLAFCALARVLRDERPSAGW